jgi:5'-nucleotidase
VLLVHQGGEQPYGNDPNDCVDVHGGIDAILRTLSPDIKVVITGHTHQFYNCTIDGRSVTSASAFGRMLTRVHLTVDVAHDTIVAVSAHNEVVTHTVEPDAVQTALIRKYRARAAPVANRVVGSVAGDILRASTRAGESALGDLIADAQLAATSPAGKGGALVAFMNQGGIRADVVMRRQTDGQRRPGEVTYGDLFAVQPFNNRLSVFTLTGDAVKRVLEQQFGPDADGTSGVLQVSRGFTYRYRFHAPAGQHVDAASIAINGQPLAPTASVRVAAVDFLAAGGDGFSVFTEGRDPRAGPLDVDALESYVRTHSPVESGTRDRIVRTD